MFKKLFKKEENKGYVSVEVIIIAGLILALFTFLFIRWQKTADDLSTSTIVGMQEKVNDMKDPVTGESFIDMANDTTTLLAQKSIKTQPLTFDKSLNQEQTLTFTVDKLNKIKSLTASNGGEVEIVSVDGNEVTIKVKGGEPAESVVIAGEYISYDEKVVTAQDSQNYDDGAYKGTLKQYLHSGEASKITTVTETKTYTSLSAVPNTNTYGVAGYVGTLSKDGETEKVLVSGTPADTKTITETASVTGTSNTLATSKTYNKDGYTGTLTRGTVTSTLIGTEPSGYYQDTGYYEPTGYYESTGYYRDTGYYQDTGYWNETQYWKRWACNTSGTICSDTDFSGSWETQRTWVSTGQQWVSTGQEWVSTGSRWVSTGSRWVKTGTEWVDTTVNKYEYTTTYTGTVSKPDTRVYNYVQSYTGEVKTPDTRVYKYQGIAVRPESDTREYEHYYQYDVNVEYFEKQ